MSRNDSLISIIVPVYNVEQYLSRCVNSLVNQTYHNIEIILVDDGSPDRCGEMCDEYAKRDKRVVVIHKSNGGLSDARNKGLDVAKGDYVMFVDSDDWIELETCSIIIGLAVKYEVDVVSFGIQLVGEKGIYEIQRVPYSRIISSYEGVVAMVYQQKRKGILNYVCNKIFKKILFENIRFPLGALFEDQDVTYKLIHKANLIYVTEQVFYNYYQREGSIMSNFYHPRSLHDRIQIWMKRCEFINKYYPEYKDYQLALLLGDIYISLIILKGNSQYIEFYKEIKRIADQWNYYESNLIKYNNKVKLHYYCYPLFWLYVKLFIK